MYEACSFCVRSGRGWNATSTYAAMCTDVYPQVTQITACPEYPYLNASVSNCVDCVLSLGVWCVTNEWRSTITDGICLTHNANTTCSTLSYAWSSSRYISKCPDVTSSYNCYDCTRYSGSHGVWCNMNGQAQYCAANNKTCMAPNNMTTRYEDCLVDSPDNGQGGLWMIALSASLLVLVLLFGYWLTRRIRRNQTTRTDVTVTAENYTLMGSDDPQSTQDVDIAALLPRNHPRYHELSGLTEAELRQKLIQMRVDDSWCRSRYDLISLILCFEPVARTASAWSVSSVSSSVSLSVNSSFVDPSSLPPADAEAVPCTTLEFPTGIWIGYYSGSGPRLHMRCGLRFKKSKVSGRGHDNCGPFTVTGVYSSSSFRVSFVKRYANPQWPVVEFQGTLGPKVGAGIQGNWYTSQQANASVFAATVKPSQDKKGKSAAPVLSREEVMLEAFGYFHIWPETGFNDTALGTVGNTRNGSFSQPLGVIHIFDTPQETSLLQTDRRPSVLNLDDDACIICADRLMDCVLLRCGHICTCLQCARRLTRCPICRKTILEAIMIHAAGC